MVNFEPMSDTGHGQNIGTLSIPMDAQILINDGQHRRAAIEETIKGNPELAYDNISVLFFLTKAYQEVSKCLQTSINMPYDPVTPSVLFMI